MLVTQHLVFYMLSFAYLPLEPKWDAFGLYVLSPFPCFLCVLVGDNATHMAGHLEVFMPHFWSLLLELF